MLRGSLIPEVQFPPHWRPNQPSPAARGLSVWSGRTGPRCHECVDPAANVRNVGEWQMLGDEIKIGSACAKKLEVRRLAENAGTELWCSHLRAASIYILQVREHEAILESVQ